jgi:hypothetical protein
MILKQKSEENAKAAQLLADRKNKYYAASIHCSYYSSIQMLMYILNTKYHIPYQQQEKEADSIRKGTHNYLIDEIGVRLKKKQDATQIRRIQKNIRDLKDLRKGADYKPVQIDILKAQRAIELSNEIINELKQCNIL